MMKGLLLLVIIFLIFLAQGEAKPPPSQYLVKPNCQAECGKVVIPYPFGIGKNCYMNEWYSVDCRKAPGRPTRPFLTRLNLELIYVSLDHQTVTVKSPVASYHPQDTSSGGQLQPSIDLGGSPFVFSRLDNKFAVLGCGNVKLVMDNGKTLAGCASLCSGGHRNEPGCYGIGCCQTSLPSRESYYLNSYNVSFTPEDEGNGSSSGPIHAFLVESDWLSRRFMELEEVLGAKHAPLSLFWFLKKGDTSSHPDCNGTTLIYNPDSESYVHYTCSCPPLYEGNPYLRNGCHVVKECVNCLKTCHYNYHFNNDISNGRESYIISYHCPKRNAKDRPKALILGFSISGGSFLLVFGCFGLYKFVKKQKEIRRKRHFFKQNGGLLLEQQISSDEVGIDKAKIFTSKELEKATDNFSSNRVLGQGGQGKVYKGMLPDGKIIAIKKSMAVDRSQIGQFINEIVILSQINHRNIVRILGCCLETEVPLVVYEFIPNGTLFQYIHTQDMDFSLSWEKRLQIATEVGEALFYLHSACSIPIYHRDIKSTNILLDDKYRAKVSDFGTSRSISIGQTHLTTNIQGTFGYLDPEYFQSSHFTEKSDVYSFGVVLAELLTGQKPICLSRPEEEKSLVTHFNLAMEESRLFDILDATVAKEGGEEEVKAVAELAHRCLNMSRGKRPTMKEVSVELERIRVLSLPPLMQVDEQNLEESASVVMGMTESPEYGTSSSPFAGPPNGGASSSARSCLLRRTTSSEEQHLLFNTI